MSVSITVEQKKHTIKNDFFNWSFTFLNIFFQMFEQKCCEIFKKIPAFNCV